MRAFRIGVLAAAFFLALCLGAAAWAGYGAWAVRNLSADSHDGRVFLSWTVDVREKGFLDTSSPEVLIFRQQVGGPPSMDLVARLPVPQEAGEGLSMSWEDAPGPPGTKWTYSVRLGRMALPPRAAEATVTVLEGPKAPESAGPLYDQRRREYEESADWPERLAGSLIMAIPNYLVKVLGLYDPVDLIFQPAKPATSQAGSGFLSHPGPPEYLHVFTERELGALSFFYDRLSQFFPVHLMVALVVVALGLWWSAMNPESRLTFKDYFLGVCGGVLLYEFGAQALTFLFDLNWMVVKEFQYIVGDRLGQGYLASFYNNQTASLGAAILAFIAVFSIGIINWQYIMRKISIALLLGLIPLVAVASIPPSNRRILGVWFRELLANVFLQSGHAAAFAFLILLIHGAGKDAYAFWLQLAGLLGLPAMASLVRRVVGAEDFGGGLGGIAAGALGLGALFTLGRSLAGFRRGGMLAGLGAAAGGLLGGVAGSMAGGAAGMPGMGMAVGALAGAGGASLAAGVGRSAWSFAAAARREGAAAVLGDMYDPRQAYEAGKTVFGDNVVGRAAGSVMAGGSWVAGKFARDRAAAAKAPRLEFEALERSLAEARPRLEEAGREVEAARAKHTVERNMWGPQAVYRQKVEAELAEIKKQLPDLETDVREWEGKFVEDLYWLERGFDAPHPGRARELMWETAPPAAQSALRLGEAYGKLEAARNRESLLSSQLESGKKRYQETLEAVQRAEAEHARLRLEVADLENSLRHNATYQRLEKLREKARGVQVSGWNAPAWR